MRLVAVLLLTLVACKGREPESKRSPPPARCTPGQPICVGDAVVACDAAGTAGKTLEQCKDGCRGGRCSDTCAVKGVELI